MKRGFLILKKEKTGDGRNNRKTLMAGAVILFMGICIALICMKVMDGSKDIGFEYVKESKIPHGISTDVIPEYKTLERALACMEDDDVYVVVTRGEKPTSGYRVSIERMFLEEDGKTDNLVVYAEFKDPEKKMSVSQIITYPVQVVKTDLKKLPDTIELRIQYE